MIHFMTHRAHILLGVAFVAGTCLLGSCTGNEAGETPGSGDTGVDESDTGDPEPTVIACSDPPPPPPPGVASNPFPLHTVTDISIAAADCPDSQDLVIKDAVESSVIPLQVWYPSLSMGTGLPNDTSTYPLIVFEHGNTHSHHNYDGLLGLLTAHGFIVANIASGPSSTSIARSARQFCTTARLLGDEIWDGSGRLDGTVFLMGHSTGGEGAVRAAQMAKQSGVFDSAGRTLRGVIALAPACNESTTFLEQGETAFLGLQGSRDEDTPYCMFKIGDRSSGPEEFFDPPIAAPHITILAHGHRHGMFGGQSPPTALAMLLYESYLIPFLELQAFELNQHRSLFFGTGINIPPALDDPSLWPFNFLADEAPLFGSVRDISGGDFHRIVLDAFQNLDPEVSTHQGSVGWDSRSATLIENSAIELGTGPAATRALKISALAGATVTWEIVDELRPLIAHNASHLRLRLGVDPQGDFSACEPTLPFVPPIRVALKDADSSSPSLNLNDYARLRPADVHFQGGGGLMGNCEAKIALQSSVRIPLADFCDGGDLVLDELTALELTFDEDVEIIIDNIEFGQSPGDPALAGCKCYSM
jgi:pimeloyl-ACP methyl ester carboxylesterase